MKLVDILALHLSEWPAEDPFDLGQAHDGDIHIPGRSGKYIRHLGVRLPLADNWGSENVTRAQWQAAVDAPKAEPSAKCWVGIGLPPVGTVCEYLEDGNGDWEKVEIVAIDQRLDYKFAVFHGDKGYSGDRRVELFRPIQTPEQFARQERSRICDKMYGVILDKVPQDRRNNGSDICEALYDAGYRKFEIVDN